MANNNSNLIEKLLGGSGLNQVWVKVFSLVKILTGDVDVKNKGNLQKQIDDVRSDVEGIMDGTGDTGLVFADDTESEYDTAIGQVVSGKPLSVLFQYLKAALKSAYTLAQKAYNVAAGKNQARVFATVDALDEWLGDPDNLAQLHVGDNFYIVALDVPDYWWDGEQKQPLETQKVDMTTYDQAIAALQSADTKLNEDITDHKDSADHDGRYYTETEVNNLLSQKAASSHNHDSRYYTESEIDSKLNGKAASSHTHDDRYYTESEIDSKLKQLIITRDVQYTFTHHSTAKTITHMEIKEPVVSNYSVISASIAGSVFADQCMYAFNNTFDILEGISNTGGLKDTVTVKFCYFKTS